MKIFNFFNDLTAKGKIGAIILLILVVCGVIYVFNPGAKVAVNKALSSMSLDSTIINNTINENELELPSAMPSKLVSNKPLVKIAEYAWFGNAAMIQANGGAKTTQGSIMESNGINLLIQKQNDFSLLQSYLVNACKELNDGTKHPNGDLSFTGAVIMGDGVRYFAETLGKTLDDTFGDDKYHIQVYGAIGASYGEDKLIGPMSWKTNPQSMKGAVISVVVGDGDWISSVNFISANKGLKINPNLGTYDAEAVNFINSEDSNYMNSAHELISSQLEGRTWPLKEIKDGKLTGKTIDKIVDGCATWLPGDKVVFDALSGFTDVSSTKDFPNQMATTVLFIKEWADQNKDLVYGILKSTYIAGNQMKLYDSWYRDACKNVSKTYGIENEDYWYKMSKGFSGTKNGISYNIGGTRIFNYADALQYYGISDGKDRYKAVYEQVGKYLNELNPGDYKNSIDKSISYESIMNLTTFKSITGLKSETVQRQDYAKTNSNIMASGNWSINFETGSAKIMNSSLSQLDELYNLLIQAEGVKIIVDGHTDNTGSYDLNKKLSKQRAESVVNYLINKGLDYEIVQSISGKGSDEPIDNNNTIIGRSKNRRVQVILLN